MIGKTRHAVPLSPATFAQGCGVLRHSPPPGAYRHTRYAPPGALADWVQHFWVESWDLRGAAPQIRDVLPHPCVHLAFVRGRTRIYGVHLGHFVRELKGAECVFGVKFRPGAFYPFLRKPVGSIANVSFPAQQLFSDITAVEEELLASSDVHHMVEVASQFLLAHLPPRDPIVEQACGAVETNTQLAPLVAWTLNETIGAAEAKRGRVIIQGQATAGAKRFPWIPWIPRSLGWHVVAKAGTVKIATRC